MSPPKQIRTRYTEFGAEHIDSHPSNVEGGTCLRTFSASVTYVLANMPTPCISLSHICEQNVLG